MSLVSKLGKASLVAGNVRAIPPVGSFKWWGKEWTPNNKANKTEHMLDMPIRVRKSYGEVYNHKDLESTFLRINLLQIDGYLRS